MGDKNDDDWIFGEANHPGPAQQQIGAESRVDFSRYYLPTGNVGDGAVAAGSWMGSWMGSSSMTSLMTENNTELKLQITELKIKCMEKEQEDAKKLAKQEEFNVALVNNVEELTKAVAKLSAEKANVDLELDILRQQSHNHQQQQTQGDGHSAGLVKKLEEKLKRHEQKLAHLLTHHWERVGACLVQIADNCWHMNQAIGGLALSFDCLVATCQADKGFTNVRSKLAFSDDEFRSVESEHCRRLFYFEILVKKKFGTGLLYVGLSGPDFAIASDQTWVGKSANSFALCSDGTVWNAGDSSQAVVVNEEAAGAAGTFGENDVVGVGILAVPTAAGGGGGGGQGRQLVITKNGQSIGKLFALPSGSTSSPAANELLFPTVSLQGYGTTVEANFGADLVQRPFAYDWILADLCALGLRSEKNVFSKQPQHKSATPNVWDKFGEEIIVNGLLVTKTRGTPTYGNVMAKYAYATLYYEVLIKATNGGICIGVSGTDFTNSGSFVGGISGSCGIHSNGYCYKSGNAAEQLFSAIGFDSNDIVGCGVTALPGTEKCMFFATRNGKMLGNPTPFPSNGAKEMFPAISLHGSGTFVEANFGNKPFSYNIAEHKFS